MKWYCSAHRSWCIHLHIKWTFQIQNHIGFFVQYTWRKHIAHGSLFKQLINQQSTWLVKSLWWLFLVQPNTTMLRPYVAVQVTTTEFVSLHLQGSISIKRSSLGVRDFHYKTKQSHLYNETSYTGKTTSAYWHRPLHPLTHWKYCSLTLSCRYLICLHNTYISFFFRWVVY